MSSIWHFIEAAGHWLYAHLAALGISTVVTAIGGAAMWFLGFRKARLSNQKLALEIDHIRIDTRRIDLEVQRLTDEKAHREATAKVINLTERIVGLAKERTRQNPTWGSSAPFREVQLCSELNESPEAIAGAFQALKAQGRASYRGQAQTWIVKV